jgi:hypothetical protein
MEKTNKIKTGMLLKNVSFRLLTAILNSKEYCDMQVTKEVLFLACLNRFKV